MYIPHYLGILHGSEQQLLESFQVVADRHTNEFEIREMCKQMAGWSAGHIQALQPFTDRYGEEKSDAPMQLRSGLFHGNRAGGLGLLHDLQDLGVLANSVVTNYTILVQVAMTTKDQDLLEACTQFREQANRQTEWICTQIKLRSPQVVTVPPDLASEAKASLPERPTLAAVPDQAWAPLAAGGLVLAAGLLSLAAGQVWLFPSLGPTAYLMAESPAYPASRIYNTVVGHGLALLAGFGSVALLNVWNDPVALQDHRLTAGRVIAAALAIALTLLLALLARASHPPAAATALLVALGSLKTPLDALNLMIGALILGLLGELIRRLRIGKVARVQAEPNIPPRGTGR